MCSSVFICSKYHFTSGTHNSCLSQSLHPLFCDDPWALSERRLKKFSHLKHPTISYSLLMDQLQDSLPVTVKWSFTNGVWETHSKFLFGVCVCVLPTYMCTTYIKNLKGSILLCVLRITIILYSLLVVINKPTSAFLFFSY